jgi:hypothetical protein
VLAGAFVAQRSVAPAEPVISEVPVTEHAGFRRAGD